jgi:alanine or glycine:cation symporter, AGCS family
VIDFSDAMIFIMAIPNVIGLYLLMPVVRHELVAYEERRRTGEVRSHRRGAQAVQRPGMR